MMVISLVVSQLLHLFFSEKNSGIESKDQQHFKVILQQGVVGCIAQDKFDLVQKLYMYFLSKHLLNIEIYIWLRN